MEHGGDLELEIAERLGFSPSLFAMKIVQKWGMSEEQCHAMGISRTKAGAEVLATEDSKESDDEAGPKSAAPKETSDYLAEVCAIGELLAQANDPASYPKQKGEWDSLEKHIEQALGPRGLMRVRERFQENCQSYVKALPGILEGSGALFDRERYPDSPVIQRALRKNKYILNCDGSVQMDLKRLYTLLDEQTTVNRETVRRLVHEMIPEAGFSAGCVYTFDPSMSVLVPQMKIGTVSAHEVKSVNVSIQGTDEHPVSKAFRSPEPILAYSYTEDDRPLIAIAGPFGQHRRFGVLYLESEVQNLSDENAQESVRIHFRAFAKALNDCLKL